MAIIDSFRGIFANSFVYGMRAFGWGLGIGLYALLYFHVHIYFSLICSVQKKRLGVTFSLVWVAIGLSLLYNIIWNHFLAMMIKPGSPLLL